MACFRKILVVRKMRVQCGYNAGNFRRSTRIYAVSDAGFRILRQSYAGSTVERRPVVRIAV